MISSLECLIRLLDEQDRRAVDAEAYGNGEADDLFHEREVVERELLLSPIQTDGDAVSKLRYLARILGDGERSDGLDIGALAQLSIWMEQRFKVTQPGSRVAAA